MALQNLLGDLALESTLQELLVELRKKLNAEGATVNVGNVPTDYPDTNTTAKLEAVRGLLAGTLQVQAASLPLPPGAATDAAIAALGEYLLSHAQPVTATALPLPLGAATEAKVGEVLTELQKKPNAFPDDYPDTTATAKLEAVRALLAGGIAVSIGSAPLPEGAATNTVLESTSAAQVAQMQSGADNDQLLRMLVRALAKMTFSGVGLRADLQGQTVAVNINASQSVNVGTIGAAAIGVLTPNGASVHVSC